MKKIVNDAPAIVGQAAGDILDDPSRTAVVFPSLTELALAAPPVNNAPIANNDSYTARPGQTLAIAAPGFLANDSDPDGDSLTAVSVNITGLQGSLVAFPDGHFNFTPTAGFVGTTSFTYTMGDGFGGNATGTVSINVVNNAPIANNDSYTARPGQTLAIAAPGFLANDSDPDGDSLTAVSVNITGLQGSLFAFPDGRFNFTPTAGFVGTTSFTYTMGDGFGGNATGTVSINVVNNAPIANNDSYTARPGQTLAIAAPGFLANDSDPDGDSLTAVSVNITGLQGSLVAFPDGHFNFTPTAGFVGTTSFTYTMGDGFGGNATGTVSINVVNNAPIANNDSYTARPGQTLAIAAPGFLANDSDPDGDSLTAVSVNITGLQGSLFAFPDGRFNFTPTAGFVGTTSFTYTMGDGFGGNATGTVSINVVNNAPIANNDSYTARPGQTLAIAAPGFLANDSDPDGDSLTAVSVNITGLQGSLVAFPDGHFNFTPTAGFVGTTSFTYTMGDGFGGNATGTVAINVGNNAPIANDDNYSIRPGQTLAIAAPGLLANDSDPDGDPLSITLVNITGLQGSLVPFADGHFSFTPTAGFVGTTSFTYNVKDNFGANDTATVSINVVNNAPIANDDSYSIRPGQTLSIAAPGLLANDSDPDGDPLSITLVNITGLQGSLVPFADGHFSFTPTAGFVGTTSFTYNVKDNFGANDTATVSINVVNNAPIANDDSYNIRPGQTLSIAAPGLLANDSDPDGDPLSITLVNITGLQGSLVPFADGHFSFTPTAGFVGTTSFTYNVKDSFGANDTATVSINVVNNAPIANDESYAIYAGQTLHVTAPGLLTNDTDPDGDPLSLSLFNTTGLQGTLSGFPDGHFNFTPNAGFTGSSSFAYTVSDGFGGFDTATVSIHVAALPTETRSIGNAPERQSGPGGQWATAWTNPAIVNSIVHKADVTSTAGWSAVQFSGLSPQTLSGGDIYSGDLGVSGQSVASSSVRQEIDGKEGLRFNLSQSATELTVYLSRLFTQDDSGAYVESGRIRLLDSAGNLVKEGGFHAQNPGGTLAVTLHSDLAFSAVEINAGVYDTANTFIYGGYAQADGSFASGVLTDTLGGKHGSDFLVDKIDFQVPLSTVPLDVFIV